MKATNSLDKELAQLRAENAMLKAQLASASTEPPVSDHPTPSSGPTDVLAKVLSIVPNVIYVFNLQKMSNEYSNKEIAATLGYSESEIQGMGANLFPSLCHPADLPIVMEHFDKIRSLAKGEIAQLEYRMKRRDGSFRWLLSMDTVFERDASNKVTKHIGAASDITELKNTQERLFKVNEELENFTYIASHDLKTPLINIESILLLLKTIPEIAANDSMGLLDMLEKSINQGKKILNNLMFVAQTNLDRHASPTPCELREIAEETIDNLGFSLHALTDAVELDFSAVPSIRYNEAHLDSIFSNLMSNALKYRKPEETLKIKISSEKVGDQVCISFRDNGLGFDVDKDLKKVLGMFQRAHKVGEGSGTGLYLVQKILEANHGRLEIDSQRMVGSTFRVFLKPQG